MGCMGQHCASCRSLGRANTFYEEPLYTKESQQYLRTSKRQLCSRDRSFTIRKCGGREFYWGGFEEKLWLAELHSFLPHCPYLQPPFHRSECAAILASNSFSKFIFQLANALFNLSKVRSWTWIDICKILPRGMKKLSRLSMMIFGFVFGQSLALLRKIVTSAAVLPIRATAPSSNQMVDPPSCSLNNQTTIFVLCCASGFLPCPLIHPLWCGAEQIAHR